MRQIRARVTALWITLVTPNAKQKEAYSRYCHTLSAAGVIGALTLVFSESPMTAFIGVSDDDVCAGTAIIDHRHQIPAGGVMQIDWFLVAMAVVAIPLFLLSVAVNRHQDKKRHHGTSAE